MSPVYADVLRPTTAELAVSVEAFDATMLVRRPDLFELRLGDVLKVGLELMRVLRGVPWGDDLYAVDVQRGWAGSNARSHLAGGWVELIGVSL